MTSKAVTTAKNGSTGNGHSGKNEKSQGTVETIPTQPSTSSSSSSVPASNTSQDNAILIRSVTYNVLFHLLGILFGFILCYLSYRTECARRITQIRNDTNIAIQSVQKQQEEQQSVISDFNNKLQQQKQQELAIETRYEERIAEMKLRENSLFTEQSALMTKHTECIQSKTILYDQLQQYQQNELNEKLQLHNITTECDLLRNTILQQGQTIEMMQSSSEHQHSKISNQLNLTKRMLHEKIEEVERLNTIIGNDTNTASATTRPNHSHKLTKEMTQIQADIKRQQYALTMSTYGKTPLMSYHVIMLVQKYVHPNGIGPVVTLEIELNALYDMPHTTYTFLSMIEHQLLQETTLSVVPPPSNKKQPISNDIRLVGGHPNTGQQSKHQSLLKRSYAELGYNIQQILYFTERNTKYKCSSTSHTIGFVEYGPEIEIYFHPSSPEQSHNTKVSPKHTCFGQIISGIDALLLPSSDGSATAVVDTKMRLRIIQTRIVKKDHIIQSNHQKEEL